jgi:branched-chain amino acid transport system substrate-binding protein
MINKGCSKYGIQYDFNTHALAVEARPIVKNGGKSWYFITTDYAFGHSLQKNATAVINELGGTVLGSSDVPLGTNDFSSYLLQAKASGAEVIGLANAGQDLVNAVKQAHEFGITQSGTKLAGLLVFINDVKSLGLDIAQNLLFTTAFYWDRNEATRQFSKRFFKKHGVMPNMQQAGTYSAVTTYLKAVKAAGTDDADKVRTQLGKMTINDLMIRNGHIEPNGMARHDMFLARVKSPEKSEGEWDLLDIIATIPANKAFGSLSESTCPLLNQ